MTLKLDETNPLATKVQTRGGRSARIITVECEAVYQDVHQPIVALVGDGEFQSVLTFSIDGSFRGIEDDPNDLINMVQVGWVNHYENGRVERFNSRDGADIAARTSGMKRVACLEFSFVEGEGLE